MRPMMVVVRDASGNPLPGVRLTVTGGAKAEASTDASGTATFSGLKDGTYRIRMERDGFITLERETTVRPQMGNVEVVLSPAPPPPAPPPPAPAPIAPEPRPAPALGPSGAPISVSIPQFLDKNFIGRDPLKESILACNAAETVRLLQLRDSVGEHTHADLDEVLYVVAGEGAIRLGGADGSVVGPGFLTVVPHGTAHAIERRGKNPLIVLSTLAGGPCKTAAGSR